MARTNFRKNLDDEVVEESVTPGTTDVPKHSEDGANEGKSGETKKRKYPNILNYFPMASRGL
jgi:hypothetical protein